VTDRFRIDWENISPFPREKRNPGATRDDLAARKHSVQKSTHKGRNHLSNQKRRQIARDHEMETRATAEKRLSRFRTFKDAVRAYWMGDRDEHP
jgi:hypothetical protein